MSMFPLTYTCQIGREKFQIFFLILKFLWPAFLFLTFCYFSQCNYKHINVVPKSKVQIWTQDRMMEIKSKLFIGGEAMELFS